MTSHINNSDWYPGQIFMENNNFEVLNNRDTIKLLVKNTGDRPIQVGSHYHFFETNRFLEFDRKKSYGMRLGIPSGTAIRFEPGQTYEITLISIGGERTCYGLNGLVNGFLDDENIKSRAFSKAKELGFKGV